MLIFVHTSFIYMFLSVPRSKPKSKDMEWIFCSKVLIYLVHHIGQLLQGAPNPRHVGIISSESYTCTGKYDQIWSLPGEMITWIYRIPQETRKITFTGKKTLFNNTGQALDSDCFLPVLPLVYLQLLTPQQFVGNFHSNLVNGNLSKSLAVLNENLYDFSSKLKQWSFGTGR